MSRFTRSVPTASHRSKEPREQSASPPPLSLSLPVCVSVCLDYLSGDTGLDDSLNRAIIVSRVDARRRKGRIRTRQSSIGLAGNRLWSMLSRGEIYVSRISRANPSPFPILSLPRKDELVEILALRVSLPFELSRLPFRDRNPRKSPTIQSLSRREALSRRIVTAIVREGKYYVVWRFDRS